MIRVADDLRLGRWRSGGKGPYQGRAPFVNPHLTKGAAGRPQLGRPAAQHQDIEAKKSTATGPQRKVRRSWRQPLRIA